MHLYILRTAKRSVLLFVAGVAPLLFCMLCACSSKGKAPAEKVTIAVATVPETLLMQIATSRGFFRDEGLDATVRIFPYGKLALREVLQKKADLATVAETPVMFAIMGGEEISIIATIANSNASHFIVGRRDRGITGIGDLQGRKVATTVGTSSDFFLDAMLLGNGVSRKTVQVVDLPAEDLPGALARGEVDAVAAFAPYTLLAQKGLGGAAIVMGDKDIYRIFFNMVATPQFIRDNPGKVRKVLKALARAQDYLKDHPAESQKIGADFTGMQMEILKEVWRGTDFSLTLYQTLIVALEDESDWAMRKGTAKRATIPNYLRHVYLEGLQSVKPGEVRILK